MADKKFTLTFDVEGNIRPIKGAIQNFQSVVKKTDLKIPVGIQGNIDKVISKLNAEIEEFENITSQGFANMSDISKAEKSFTRINGLMKQLGEYGKQIRGIDPKKFLPKEVIDRTERLQKAFDKLGDISLADKANTKKIEAQTEVIKKQQEEVEKLKTKYDTLAAENKASGARKGNLSSSIKVKEKEAEAIKKQMEALEKVKGGKTSAEYQQLNAQFKDLTKTIRAQKDEFNSLDASVNKNKTVMSGLKVQLDSAQNSLNQMNEQLKLLESGMGSTEELENLRKELALLKQVNIDQIPTDLEELKKVINSLNDQPLEKIEQSMEGIEGAARDLTPAAKKAADSLDKLRAEGKELTRTEQEIENLKNQVLDFFSITNTVQIFKNAVRDAFNTIKELDAVMTETAVVTDFSVGDMWEKLPEYAEQANKLGSSIKNLYAANTLYYQQGLNSQQAMNVGVETMKMARIANMDAAQATEAMTAALRGFNMEINETSATRINDVYSELAAITAADTSQIATAMSKTASIAASANMEFETTAALLAQIIETTQEAPETAGTAMKTIIARFTEVKQLFSEGMLTGEDSEGEEISINKIDAALKTVGISLKDFLTGSKGIDDIFLELASKWDTLDLATQRYIATTAAGSRQQSRFLAMMSNYGRTMELVGAANNSAGASQKQFDKTTESLEAKLQRLKNAWAEFTMGLANNEVIKAGVDLLTDLLNSINKLTDAGDSGLGKFTTSLLRLGTVLIGLKGGQAAINGLIKFLTNSGVTEMLGIKGAEGSKIDFFGALKKSGEGLRGTFSKLKGEFSNALAVLKDPAWRGEALAKLGSGLKGLSQKVLGFVKSWGVWIALLVAAIALIKKFIEIHNAAQKSAKMEAAQESMKALAEETEAANNELNAIADSKKDLASMTDTLNNLTKGTDEWKQSLIAVNQEVLKLISEYPELAGYVITGENGQLSIDDAGWDKIYSDQMNLISNLNGLQSATAAQIKELQAGMDFDNFVINTQDTAAEKWIAEKELEIADTFDTKVGKNGNLTVGDLVAAANDGMTLSGDPGAAAGQAIAALINQWLGNPSPKTMSQINQEVKNQGGYAADVQRNKTGGLTQKEYTEFAAALVEAGVYLSDKDGLSSTDRAKAEKIYSDFGFDADFFDSVMIAAQEVGQDFDELGNKVLSLSIQEEQAAKNFVRNAVASAEELAGLEYGDAITEFLAGVKNYDNLTEEIEKEKQKILTENTTNQLLEKYAAMYGKYYADGKLYSDSSMSNEITGLSDDYLANAIASANITVQVKEEALDIVKGGLKGKDTKLFDDLFSAEGTQISSEQVLKYKKGEKLDTNQIAIDMGFESLQDMATKLGASVEDLTSTLMQNFDSAADRIAKQRKDLTKQMSKYSSKDLEGFEINAGILAALEVKFGEQIRYTLENVISSLEGTGDKALISKGYEQFRNVAMTGTPEEVKELSSYIESIDWSNPIETAHTLNQEIKNGTGLAKDFAQEMMAVESSFLGAGNQMQYFLKSNDFEEMKEDLSKIVEQNGEIAASDILDLAEDYQSLNKILKNTDATAGGLAKTLQLVAEGELGVHQLTDAVMAALEGFDSLDSLVAKTLKTLSDFDPGMDENEVADFVNTAYETISANLKAGAVGNNQNFSYLDFMFPGWREGLSGDELVAQMEYLTGKLEENSVNMRRAWSDLAAGKDIYGNAWKFDENSGRTADDLKIDDTGSDIKLTGWEDKGMTTQDMVDWIADAYNVSDNYAKMMLADFKNYSADLAQELNANDYAAGMEKAYDKLKTISVGDVGTQSIIDKKIIDESEIEAIATLYNKKISDVRQDFLDQGALITDFFDENGLLQETAVILSQLDQIAQSGGADGAKWVGRFIKSTEDGFSSLDVSELNLALGEVGIPESAKAGITQDIVDSMLAASNEQPVYIDLKMSDGVTRAIEVTPEIDVQTAIANAETELANSNLAEAIASAFKNITFAPEISGQDLTNSVVTAIKAADGTVVTILPDQESLIAITTSIEGAASAAKPYVQVNSNINDITSAINSISKTVTVTVKYEEKGKPSSNVSSAPINAADPNYFVNNATGVKKADSSYDAIVSEEGPELIQTKDGSYLTGQNGPEVAQINKGDTVYTAEETAQIFKKRSHTMIPRYAEGYGHGNAYGGSSGGKSSDDDEDTWENPFDKLYNLIRKIDEELRQRERIERRYEKLLESLNVSANKIISVSREELAQLEREHMLQEQLIEGRKYQIDKYQQENADLMKYANVTQNERGEDVLRINWDLIDQVTDTEEGERIEEYVSQLEEWFGSLEEAEDALWNIEDAVAEIKERGKEEYFELEDTIKEALTQSYQEEIDKLSQINESINDTNSSLIEAIQKSIDKQRQDRDNQRTEEDIAEKQRRLAYLQQDTSGANDLEILRLQEEISQEQEDYTDTLIDQKISELQQQNDEAARQREQQITLAQAQLEHFIESGEIWKEVSELMDAGLDKEHGLIRGSRLEEILRKSENFTGMSEIAKMEWLNETNNMIAQALAYLEVGRQLEDIGTEAGTEIEFTNKEGQRLTGIVDEEGNVKASDGKTYNNVFQGADGRYYSEEDIPEVEEPEVEEPKDPPESEKPEEEKPKEEKPTSPPATGWTFQGKTYYKRSSAIVAIQDWHVLSDKQAEARYLKKQITAQELAEIKAKNNVLADGYVANMRSVLKYKTGGLADFTGPAWLDGTKARPELVLNARDTANFIQLKDILSSIMSRNFLGISTATENNGDINYDIDINVETIGSDYDVEQVANKVKSMISENGRYRNNNAISLKR